MMPIILMILIGLGIAGYLYWTKPGQAELAVLKLEVARAHARIDKIMGAVQAAKPTPLPRPPMDIAASATEGPPPPTPIKPAA